MKGDPSEVLQQLFQAKSLCLGSSVGRAFTFGSHGHGFDQDQCMSRYGECGAPPQQYQGVYKTPAFSADTDNKSQTYLIWTSATAMTTTSVSELRIMMCQMLSSELCLRYWHCWHNSFTCSKTWLELAVDCLWKEGRISDGSLFMKLHQLLNQSHQVFASFMHSGDATQFRPSMEREKGQHGRQLLQIRFNTFCNKW